MGFPGSSESKESACSAMQKTAVQFLGQEVPLKKG